MAKKAQNRDQVEVEYIREIMEEVAAIHRDLMPLWERVRNVSYKLHNFDGKRYAMYKNLMESVRRRLYFGAEFFPYFMSEELIRMCKELATISDMIRAVMVEEDEKGGEE